MFRSLAGDDRLLALACHAVGLAAALGSAAAGWVVLHRPLAAECAQLDTEADALERLWTRKRVLEAEHTRRHASLETEAKLLREVRDRLPASSSEAEFLALVGALARELNVELSDFRVGGVKAAGELSAVEVQASAEATYADLCRFLDRLDTLPRLCRVERLHVDAGTPPEARHRVTMTLQAFFAPPTKELEG
jgi:hypothetical protein